MSFRKNRCPSCHGLMTEHSSALQLWDFHFFTVRKWNFSNAHVSFFFITHAAACRTTVHIITNGHTVHRTYNKKESHLDKLAYESGSLSYWYARFSELWPFKYLFKVVVLLRLSLACAQKTDVCALKNGICSQWFKNENSRSPHSGWVRGKLLNRRR